jgi:MoaA/NifB/PqqE/SkfB family radical SAM enzyme
MIEILEFGLKEMIDNPNLIFIYWYLTGKCNYKCDYCDIFRDEKLQDWEIKQQTINFLNHLNKSRDLRVLLYGGEPTIDPDLPKILKSLDSYIRLFTNFSKPLNYWKNIADIREDMTLTISYHLNHQDPNNFLKKMTYLIEKTNINKIRLKVMADSRYKEESIEIYKFYKNLWINEPRYECFIDLILANLQGDVGAKWSEEDMDWYIPLQDYKTIYVKYKENGLIKENEFAWNEMRMQMIDSNNYYICTAGVNLLYIESNGDVFLCKSRRSPFKPLFNVMDKKFNLPTKGIICDFMGYCCEVDFPKKLVCKRKVGRKNKNLRNLLKIQGS